MQRYVSMLFSAGFTISYTMNVRRGYPPGRVEMKLFPVVAACSFILLSYPIARVGANKFKVGFPTRF